jgi:hypothetical protein
MWLGIFEVFLAWIRGIGQIIDFWLFKTQIKSARIQAIGKLVVEHG